MPHPEPKKLKVDLVGRMTIRSKGKEEATVEAAKELRKQQEEAAAKQWKEIAEQHCCDKAIEEARSDKEKEKGKAKVQEEPTLQEELEFELHQSLLAQQEIDIARLNNLMLASTLM